MRYVEDRNCTIAPKRLGHHPEPARRDRRSHRRPGWETPALDERRRGVSAFHRIGVTALQTPPSCTNAEPVASHSR